MRSGQIVLYLWKEKHFLVETITITLCKIEKIDSYLILLLHIKKLQYCQSERIIRPEMVDFRVLSVVLGTLNLTCIFSLCRTNQQIDQHLQSFATTDLFRPWYRDWVSQTNNTVKILVTDLRVITFGKGKNGFKVLRDI